MDATPARRLIKSAMIFLATTLFAGVLILMCRALAEREYAIGGKDLGPDLILWGGSGILILLAGFLWLLRRGRPSHTTIRTSTDYTDRR